MAVAIMLLLDSLGIPLPTEASLLLTGAMIKKGALFAPYVLGVALTAAAAGSAASYWIGRRMGSRAFNTLIRLFRVPTERTSQIEESFRRHRNRAVFVARFIPFVRCLIGYPAGMAGLPFGDYMFYSLLGYGAWLTLSLLAGYGGFALLHILDLPWKTMAVGAAAAVIVWFALRTIGRPRRI
jgi:membrane protein DedA with SNARE-associated domain